MTDDEKDARAFGIGIILLTIGAGGLAWCNYGLPGAFGVVAAFGFLLCFIASVP